MTWLGIPWSEGIKKRACRYLLQRYLGQFLEEKLTLNQLTVDLYNGTGTITDVKLDVEALNELGEQHGLPLEFVDGFISKISVSIPWSTLLCDASFVEVNGLVLTVQPRQRGETSSSMFESMWNSMSSSMQLAQECLKQDNAANNQTLEGVELFAQRIDSILSKVKVRFTDTVIRLEHVPLESATGVALEIRISNLEYSDEAGNDPTQINPDPNQANKGYVVSAFSTKNFYIEGITFHTDEFPSRARTFSRSVISVSRGSSPDSKNSDQYSSAQISPSHNTQSSPEKNVLNNLSESNPIIFARLSGRQEVRLKLKQTEGVPGPKVEIDVTLGSLTTFLSPRQLHVLLELAHGLATPDIEDVSNVAPKSCAEKPMGKNDFNRIERELLNQINTTHGLRSMDLRHTQGWSTGSVEESDSEDVYFPMRAPGYNSMANSTYSTNTSLDDSMSQYSMSSKESSVNNTTKHKARQNIDGDSPPETIQFHIRVSSIAIILLHEDILTVGIEGYGLTRASVKLMQTTAEEFFKKLNVFALNGYSSRDLENAAKLFTDACYQSHIRLLAAPLIVEGSGKTTSQHSITSGSMSLATLEVVECLIDNSNVNGNNEGTTTSFIELLTFEKENPSNSTFSNKTDFRMRFKYSEKAVRHSQITKYAHPRTEIDIHLEPCQGEFDITLIDRLSAVLNPQLICTSTLQYSAPRDNNPQSMFYQAVESPTLPDYRIDIKVCSPKCILDLRFPIPDLRPLHDINRNPWWKRSVRPDYVTFHLTNINVHTSIDSKSLYLVKSEIQCKKFLLTYTEADSDVPIEIGKASVDECRIDTSLQNETEGFNWPRIVFTIFPRNFGAPLEDSSDGEAESSLDSIENTPRHQPSPFSSKCVIHESDTPHSRTNNFNDKDNNTEQRSGEELIIPGSRQEMTEFIDEGTRSARIQIEIGLPNASVQIPSKHLYELLYNRFNTDLLLWEPSAPKPKYFSHPEGNIGLDVGSTLLQESIYPKFSMCKSGIQYESDTETDEEGVFHSTIEKSALKLKPIRNFKSGQSKVALTLNVNQGIITLCTPVRDSKKNVIPGQQGEIIIRTEDVTVFLVSKFKGDDSLSYICVLAKDVSLFHCGLITMTSHTPPLRSTKSIIPKHCFRTMYRTEGGANISKSFIEKDMLRVAIRVQAAKDSHKIKTFRVALGFSNATLRYRMSSTQTNWFTELTDCLDVIDYPVFGYAPPGVLTELHVHLWDCAIDYRPVNIPLRSIVTMGSFSISSNIAAATNTSTLRFIAEDMGLFISDKKGKTVDIKSDYINVIELGLFELSLRLNDKMCGGAPRVDLRTSINVLHVRTCADSGRALMQLLTYFASDGDLATNNGSTESITVPSSEDGESLLGDESINSLSKSQVARINILMEEAMEDTVKGSVQEPQEKLQMNNKVEVFFFPDESSVPPLNDDSRQTRNSVEPQIDYDDADDEFCILGEEAGVGITPRSGVPEVRMLCDEPIKVVDNHFSVPLGKTDLLQTPKNFPSPTLRYTLCEMTLVWHIYGGKDFGDADNNPVKKHVTIDEGNLNYNIHQGRSRSVIEGISYSRTSPNKVHFGSVPNSPRARTKEIPHDWKTAGGRGRRHDVLMEFQLNKVRFQHEVYPENTPEASRQILLINEFEVRDRLASSSINKFLYQYSSEAKPRQSHANMFTAKALHIRPDPKLVAQECSLKLSLLPLRLNIDQDSLLFLITFFNELSTGSKLTSDSLNNQSTSVSRQGTPTHQLPVMTVNDNSDSKNANVTQNIRSEENLMILLEDELTIKHNLSHTQTCNEVQEVNQPIYFRRIIFRPEVLVRLDYHGKRMDLTHGPLAGILMGLAQLSCSELRLKSIINRQGILGIEKLITYMFTEWIYDIKKNQLPSLLGGVGPMYSLVQLFQGIRDLFWMPIEQYQKDGRIVRGLQRGANSFTTSTALAALELTTRLVGLIQTTAETTYDIVNYGPSVRLSIKGQKGKRKRYSQPSDIREGVANAFSLVKEGLGETANQLVRVASEEHEHKGVSGAVGGVLRQIPPTVVKPIILATEATNNVLGGMRSQLVPDARREAAQKWREECEED